MSTTRLHPTYPYFTWGGIYAPPTTYRQFSPNVLIGGGSNYTQNLSFVIISHMKLFSGQKKFLGPDRFRQSQEGSWFFAPFWPKKLLQFYFP